MLVSALLFSAIRSLFRGTEQRSTSQFGSLQDPLTALLLGGHGPTMSGINISPQTALRCSVVFGCVKVLSETVAELPLKLYRKRPDGGRDLADDHPLHWLLDRRAERLDAGQRVQAVDDGAVVSRRQRLRLRVAQPQRRDRGNHSERGRPDERAVRPDDGRAAVRRDRPLRVQGHLFPRSDPARPRVRRAADGLVACRVRPRGHRARADHGAPCRGVCSATAPSRAAH